MWPVHFGFCGAREVIPTFQELPVATLSWQVGLLVKSLLTNGIKR